MIYHVAVEVCAAATWNDDMLAELFHVPTDEVAAVRTRLVIAAMRRERYMPIAQDCNNFDPEKGCLGHESMQPALHRGAP